jgi:hypothetical protein
MTKNVTNKLQKLYNKAITGRNQAAAIKFFCLDCMGGDSQEVKDCTDFDCSLYLYRITGRKVPVKG